MSDERRVRPGKAGPKGKENSVFLKFGVPSSGCETRPVKAESRRPVASLAPAWVTIMAMRRCAKTGAVAWQPRNLRHPRAKAFLRALGSSVLSVGGERDEEWAHLAGWVATATVKRMDQEPGRLLSLLEKCRETETRRRSAPANAWPAGAHAVGTRNALASEVGLSQGEPEGSPRETEESEGCIRSLRVMTSGNGRHPDPAERRRPVLVRASGGRHG